MTTAYPTPSDATITVSRRTGRQIGYVVAIIVNLVILALINVWPGWQTLPFVTADAVDVVPIVNASIAVTVLANLVYIANDRPRVKAVGEVITGVVAIVATSALIDVFPFDFTAYAVPWDILTMAILWLALIGTGISVVVNLVKALAGPRERATG